MPELRQPSQLAHQPLAESRGADAAGGDAACLIGRATKRGGKPIYRDEYARPRGKHRAQAPKPAQAGPSLPREVDEVAQLRVSGLEALAHTTTLTQSPTTHGYWWCCTCGDEGGPYDHYTPAWDATVAHERGAE